MGASVAGPAACGARGQRSARSGSPGARERQPVDGDAVALIGTMALVVTARSPVEASATGLEGSIAHAHGRGTALGGPPGRATRAVPPPCAWAMDPSRPGAGGPTGETAVTPSARGARSARAAPAPGRTSR